MKSNILNDEFFASLDSSVKSIDRAETLPPACYTDAAFYEFEKEAVFNHEWLCVGRESWVPNPGDYFTSSIIDEPIVVARTLGGELKAMSSVCQHRGMLVAEGRGNARGFVCPYHHWTYGLDGRLVNAPAMGKTCDFDKSRHGLPQIRHTTWQGFIFINFDTEAPPLAPRLSALDAVLERYALTDAEDQPPQSPGKYAWNWKVMFENFNDGYHANRLHQYVQDFCPSSMSAFPEPWDDDSNVIFRTSGYTHIDGGFNATHRVIMNVFPELTEEERSRSTFALVPPTLCFGTAPDQCFFFLVRPTGPQTIDVEIGYIFHPSALDDPLFEEKVALSDAGVQVFVKQDQDATTKVQNGLNSRFAPRGRYSWQEESHVQFNRWLVQRYRSAWPSATSSSQLSDAEVASS